MKTVEHVMLIDDDEDDRILFKMALKGLHHNLKYIPQDNAIVALAYLNDGIPNLPDVIFLDINMPRMNGWDCLIALKESKTLRHIPVAMYSTSADEDLVEKAKELGAFTFIRKPMGFDDIMKEIRNVISRIEE